MSGVEEEPRRPSRPQPPTNAPPRPPSVNPSANSNAPGTKPLVVPTIFKLVTNNGPVNPPNFDRSARSSTGANQVSPRKDGAALPTPPTKKVGGPTGPPSLPQQPKKTSMASTSNPDLRTSAENTVLRKELEERQRKEIDLLIEIEASQRQFEQYQRDVERLNAKIRELESGGGSSPSNSSSLHLNPPSKPRPAPPAKDSTKEERSTNALLLEKKAMISVLENENVMLREDCEKAEKKNKEDATLIKNLNTQITSLQREVNSLRLQVKEEVKSGHHVFSVEDQRKMEEALVRGVLYEVSYEFEREGVDDVELKVGQFLEVLERSPDGWWKGYNYNTGLTGVFPSNYVKQKEREEIQIDLTSGRLVRALFDYDAKDVDELSFKKDDQLRIVQENSNGWWFGYHLQTNTTGLFPSNYAVDE